MKTPGTDNLTAEQRRYTMSRVKGRDTGAEMLVRRMVFALGYRYRLDDQTLPGRPDLVFARRRKVIFVHGCFWHSHGCARGRRRPQSNQEYWDAKLQRNRRRDRRTRAELTRAGWGVLVLWECQLKRPESVRRRVERFLAEADA